MPKAARAPERGAGISPASDRVVLLMLLACAFLFLSFAINWEVNSGSFEVRDRSEVLHGLGTVECSLIALAVSCVVVVLPEARKLLPFEFTRLHLVATVIGVLFLLLLVTWDLRVFADVLVQTFVLVFFSAPLIFGLYGILHHHPVQLVISAMFALFIAGGVRNPEEDLPYLILFALFFILFVELSDASIRCWSFLQDKKLSEEHLASFIDHYLRNLTLFMTAAVLLSVLILNLHYVVGAMGLAAVANSIELQSNYGQVAAAVVVLGGMALLRFLHDRGYTAPWMARARALRDRLRGRPAAAEETGPKEPDGRYQTN